MNPSPSHGAAALEKSLALFMRIVEDGGETPLSTLAASTGIPVSTSQRMVGTFMRSGLLSRVGRGRYACGLRIAAALEGLDTRSVLIAASRTILRKLARDLETTVHLGVLEGDMVTYLLKENGGGPQLLTSEMSQLEAYCSGIGKVLLAHLDDTTLNAYLAAGPFVALTANTMTDPAILRAALSAIREQGFAFDNAELLDDLYCIAAPLYGPRGDIVAAISASYPTSAGIDRAALPLLSAAALKIRARLGGLPIKGGGGNAIEES